MDPSLARIEDVYRTRSADFFHFALARLGDPERARDAVQEGFADAIRGRRSFRGEGPLEAWVARCVINAAHDEARNASRGEEPLFEAADFTRVPDPEASSDPAVETVRAAVRRLPRRQRDVLFLRHYLDFDYASIAHALEIERGTVSATLHAAREALAAHLEEVTR